MMGGGTAMALHRKTTRVPTSTILRLCGGGSGMATAAVDETKLTSRIFTKKVSASCNIYIYIYIAALDWRQCGNSLAL